VPLAQIAEIAIVELRSDAELIGETLTPKSVNAPLPWLVCMVSQLLLSV
jgi:hypothetical protein